MIWALLILHLVGIGAAVVVGWRWGMTDGLLVAGLAPAITAVWAIEQLILGAEPSTTELVWVEGLNLALRFRIDAVALMMVTLVSGIGALVFVYAIGYFGPTGRGGTRFPATLLAFSASMLGLVLADSAWTLFIFWEFTSITSFLLVGYKNTDEDTLKAARRALMITVAGGLALLVGLLMVERAGGGVGLTDIAPIDGPWAVASAVLILVAAATKSAQVPFHMWLPGAMAAPTPVSAYLHSATMVKAGVLLVALVGGAYASVPVWEIGGLTIGITSMLWGAVGALRHRDAKLILAWGTISQLGLLITLLSLGNGKATFAAISMLFAHALFKAALFAVVGEIDVRTGTRDITELHGLGRSMPLAAVVAVLAGLSMAGVPPLLGFTSKEAAIEAVLGLDGTRAFIVGVAVIGGAVLTVAYTARLLIGLFGPSSETTVVEQGRPTMALPSLVLSALGLVGFVFLGVVNNVVVPAAVELNEASGAYELLRWPGVTTGFLISMAVVVLGVVLGVVLSARERSVPAPIGADAVDSTLDGILAVSRRVTGRVQHGSLPLYLVTTMTVVALAGMPFVIGFITAFGQDGATEHLVLWDRPLQMMLAVAIVISAFVGTLVPSRLGAALTLGAVGTCVAGIFVLQGAPDLVLTQLLVETIVVVGFVVGLGHLAKRFPSAGDAWKALRIAVSLLVGVVVMVGLAVAGANPTGTAPIGELTTAAIDEGGGNNIVNVILTDIRALDTLGEVIVLAVVALGVLALANVRRLEVAS